MLIADDEPFNVISLEGILDQWEISCDKVYDGQSVIEIITKNASMPCHNHKPYNLLLIDNSMPVKSGIEVVKEIKERQFKGMYPNYNIALLSGTNAREFDLYKISKSNPSGLFNYVLEKPLVSKELKYILQLC